jgi:hypothetical protein
MDLAALLEKARSASPDRRIESRDPIAAHGAAAIEGVRPWLADGDLAAFAVRVIERAGLDGEPALAAKVLRAARTKVPPLVAEDIVWALQRLRTAAHPKPVAVVTPAAPARRVASRTSTVNRRRPLS